MIYISKYIARFITFIPLIFIISCSSFDTKKDNKNNISKESTGEISKEQKAKGDFYLEKTSVISETKFNRKQPKNAVVTLKMLNTKSHKQLLEIAKISIKSAKWNQLEMVASLISRKYHESPWGAYFLSISAEKYENIPKAMWMVDLALKKISKPYALFLYQKGRLLAMQDDYISAEEILNKANKLDPKLVDIHLYLGELYYRGANMEKSSQHLGRYLASQKGSSQTILAYAHALKDVNKIDKAIAGLEEGLVRYPKSLKLREMLAKIYEDDKENNLSALKNYKIIAHLIKSKQIDEIPSVNIVQKISELEAKLPKTQEKKK